MSKEEIELLVRKRYTLNNTELKILEEFCEAVSLRLAQLPDKSFNETQCLKSWQTYSKERSLVYTSS